MFVVHDAIQEATTQVQVCWEVPLDSPSLSLLTTLDGFDDVLGCETLWQIPSVKTCILKYSLG